MRHIVKVTDEMTSEEKWIAHSENAEIYARRMLIGAGIMFAAALAKMILAIIALIHG